MIRSMADRIACVFVQKEIVPREKSEIYSYGMELMIATTINSALVFASALIMGVLGKTLILLIPFFLLRRFAGGYHAKTHIGCTAGFLSVFWTSILIIRIIPPGALTIAAAVMLTTGAAVILRIGAIAHENCPVNEGEYLAFKKKARMTTILLLCAGSVGLYYLPGWFTWFAFGIFIAAGSLLAARIQNIKERKCE